MGSDGTCVAGSDRVNDETVRPTRQSLLERLRNTTAHRAWEEFYELYAGAIMAYARKLGVDEASAKDVLQETMVALMRLLPVFQYDARRGKFRNFLLTIVHRKTLAAQRRMVRRAEVSLDETGEDAKGRSLLETVQDEKISHPAEIIEQNWRGALWQEALRRTLADPRHEKKTIGVFTAYFVEHESASEVARRFGITENNVYQIRNRLLKKVTAEVERLQKELED